MTDPDVERELEANRRRDENRDASDPGDAGPAEDDDALFDPLTRVFGGPPDDDGEAEEEHREENDEAQRRGE